MEFIATQKFVLISPRKIRPVVYLIKKMKPVDSLTILPFTHKDGAALLAKVIKSAMASSKAKGISDTDLVFKEIQIGEGPRLKRGNPVSRGQWHPIKKRMSHIRVVLETVEKIKTETKKIEDKKEVKEVKKGIKNGAKN